MHSKHHSLANRGPTPRAFVRQLLHITYVEASVLRVPGQASATWSWTCRTARSKRWSCCTRTSGACSWRPTTRAAFLSQSDAALLQPRKSTTGEAGPRWEPSRLPVAPTSWRLSTCAGTSYPCSGADDGEGRLHALDSTPHAFCFDFGHNAAGVSWFSTSSSNCCFFRRTSRL